MSTDLADLADLAIVGGRLLDPAQGIDALGGVAFKNGSIAAVGSVGRAVDTVDASGLVLVPGLIDLHAHLYEGVSHYGVDADSHCLARGVTTAVDAGSSGAQTFPGFRRYVVEPAATRIYAFLNVAVQGLVTDLVGELEDPRWASPAETIAVARDNAEVVVGISVRLGHMMVGDEGEAALAAARRAADELELPLRAHVVGMRQPISWLLDRLGEGDIVGNCFHPGEGGGLLDGDGRLHRSVLDARKRGVLFDVGHGGGSFSYSVARAALAQDFPPDTISSDIHAHNVAGPAFDQVTTLAKLLHCGMSIADVVSATTSAPAAAIRRQDVVGSLTPGRQGDVTGLELREGSWPLTDGTGETELAAVLLVPRLVVRGGQARQL